jgi:hypothetical protein
VDTLLFKTIYTLQEDVDVAIQTNISGITFGWHFMDFKIDDTEEYTHYQYGAKSVSSYLLFCEYQGTASDGGLNHKVIDFWRQNLFDIVAAKYSATREVEH